MWPGLDCRSELSLLMVLAMLSSASSLLSTPIFVSFWKIDLHSMINQFSSITIEDPHENELGLMASCLPIVIIAFFYLLNIISPHCTIGCIRPFLFLNMGWYIYWYLWNYFIYSCCYKYTCSTSCHRSGNIKVIFLGSKSGNFVKSAQGNSRFLSMPQKFKQGPS